MDINFILIFALILAYLIGSLNFAIIISKIFKLSNPKHHGSKNAGATNMARVSGKKYGIIVLIGDALKAIIPMLICKIFLSFNESQLIYLGTAIVIGHLFPIYFNFKGGKGIATGFGFILALSPVSALFLLIIFGITLYLSRYVSLGSIMAAFFMPILTVIFNFDRLTNLSIVVLCILSILLIFMHYENIQKIYNNTENKLW